MTETDPSKCKVRKPKPGSKRDKEKLKEIIGFEVPVLYISGSVVILMFKTQKDLKIGLDRAHCYYEREALNGPLKGINMPYSDYRDWLSKVDDISVDEAKVMDLIMSVDLQRLYLIAFIKGDKSTLLHEWAHAHYFLDEQYRSLVALEYNALDAKTLKIIQGELRMRNYNESVFEDEFQAYLIESPSDFGKKLTSSLLQLHSKLRSIVKLPDIFKNA